jgi:hypothetical protein
MDTNPIYFPGKDLFVFMNGVAIGCDTTCTVEMAIKTFDNSSKCTVDAQGNLFGSMIALSTSMKITGDGFTVLDISASGGGGQGANEISGASLMDLSISKAKVFISFQVGTRFWGCDAYLTAFKQTAKYDEILSYSYTFDSSGVISKVPVS